MYSSATMECSLHRTHQPSLLFQLPLLLILQIGLTSQIPEMCDSHYGPPTHIPTWCMCLLPSVSMDHCSCTLHTTIAPCLCKLTGLHGSFLNQWLPHGNI